MNSQLSDSALVRLTQIIQAAAQASTVQVQVQEIVDAISAALNIDVCSLYRRQADNSLSLVASHGLTSPHSVVIPANRGLVGHVLRTQRPINIINPEQHPDYYYVDNSQEEEFRSFCGVPLMYRGDVNGALVVQSRRSELLDVEQDAVLATLGVHLALLLSSLSDETLPKQLAKKLYQGISGAPGLAIGQAWVQRHAHVADVDKCACDDVCSELEHWQVIKHKAVAELERERQVLLNTLGDGLASVLDAYLMLLQDETFEQRIHLEINSGVYLPWALKQAVDYFTEQFKAMGAPYLRARYEDIEHLGNKLYQIWLDTLGHVVAAEQAMPHADESFILVGHQISVSDIALLPTEKLAGIVCFAGGSLSHIAVFANALGIPAVMGVGKFPALTGERLVVDGGNAEVAHTPNEIMLDAYRRIVADQTASSKRLKANSHLPAITRDGTRIRLLANSGLQADIMPGIAFGAEGIGLYRTEIPFMLRSSLPSESEQERLYGHLIKKYVGKPVYFRTLDIGADKPLPYMPVVAEENPALGWRGVRYTLDNLPMFKTQLRALVKAAAGNEQVHVLLPMIASTEQLDQCLAALDDVIVQMREAGFAAQKPQVGIMVEVPSCIALLPFWRDKLDFISIGTNDLSQYLLALDRNSPLVGKWYDSLHPAVLHELVRIVTSAKNLQLPLSVCGEMASDPIAVLLLLGMGVEQLSMSAAKIPLIKSVILGVSVIDAQQLLQRALQLDSANAIRQLGQSFLTEKALVVADALSK